MNNLQKLDLQLKNRFLGIKTKLDGPNRAPDNANIWFLNIEDFVSSEIVLVVDWFELTDCFGITNLNENVGYGWCAPDEICDTVEITLSKVIEIIVKITKLKENKYEL